jgi:S1-C subfamily serine protease
MHAVSRALALSLLFTLPCLGPAQERDPLVDVLEVQRAVEKAIERAEPSIACILVSRSDAYREFGSPPSGIPGKLGRFNGNAALLSIPAHDPRQQQIRNLDLSSPDTVPEAYGSGVVLDDSGLILTQAHVVRRATKIYVRLPGRRGSWADIHASDPRSDLAVLRLLERVPDLRPLKIGDGSKLRKGSFVLSLSNPFAAGFRDGSPSASWGIVSNLRRRSSGQTSEMDRNRGTLHQYGTLIQTDTRLNVGCSGGALLNLQGELVGLTTSLAGITGGETPGGFAVPIDAGLQRIIDVLRQGEEVEYGFLGVYLQPDVRNSHGVQLYNVADGSPARRAKPSGLSRGDYILAINGQPVHENDDLFLLVGMQLAGSTVRIEVAQTPDGPRRTCSVKLAKYLVSGPIIASHQPNPRAGLRVDYTSILSQRDRGAIPEFGVAIREVIPSTPADQARLRPDTVITRVNNNHVSTPAEFYREMDLARGPVELTYLNPEGQEERVTLETR